MSAHVCQSLAFAGREFSQTLLALFLFWKHSGNFLEGGSLEEVEVEALSEGVGPFAPSELILSLSPAENCWCLFAGRNFSWTLKAHCRFWEEA